MVLVSTGSLQPSLSAPVLTPWSPSSVTEAPFAATTAILGKAELLSATHLQNMEADVHRVAEKWTSLSAEQVDMVAKTKRWSKRDDAAFLKQLAAADHRVSALDKEIQLRKSAQQV